MAGKIDLPKDKERRQYEMLLLSVKEIVGRNGTFCVLELSPGRDQRKIEARIWKTDKQSVVSKVPEMSVANLFLTGNEYNGELGYIADTITPGTGNAADYMPASKIDGQKMYDYITGLVDRHYADHPSAGTMKSIYETYHDSLVYYPGAVSIHHAYNGGLIMHMGTCANICHKISGIIAPKFVRSVISADTKDLMNRSYLLIKKNAGGAVCDTALTIFKSFGCKEHDEAVRKYLALLIVQRISGSYPFVDKDLLYSAMAVRRASVFTNDPTREMIGTPASDVRIADEYLQNSEIGEETARMFRHCLIVDEENDRNAVIPEAFLIKYADMIAAAAIRHAEDERFSAGTMVIAAAVHDIGKLKELDAAPMLATEYDVNGNLFGHVYLGTEMVLREMKNNGTMTDQLALDVVHCVATHHGKLKWGALTEPKTLEAEVLADVDYIDSRMDIYERCLEALEEGEKDESVRKYTGNVVYRPRKDAAQ